MTLRNKYLKLAEKYAQLRAELDDINKANKKAILAEKKYKVVVKHLPDALKYAFERYRSTSISGETFAKMINDILKRNEL